MTASENMQCVSTLGHISDLCTVEGSLEVKLPTIWTDGKAAVGRVREEKKREDQRRERVRRKGRKVAKRCVFPMICGSGGESKSRLAKAAGAEPSGGMRAEKMHAVVARSTCGSKNAKKPRVGPFPHVRTVFGSRDIKKVHAVVARSTFPSQNVKNTAVSDRFWKLTCRKKCTPLWREAHFQVKSVKN